MTMQSVFLKANQGSSVQVQTRWAGLIGSRTMQSMASYDDHDAFNNVQPKHITSLELSANYTNPFDAANERQVHDKQTLDKGRNNNYTTRFTLLSDCEAGGREAAPYDNKLSPVQASNVEYDDHRGQFELGFGQPMGFCAKYPYAEASYRAYGNQIEGRIVLPLYMTGDGAVPIYVNAKQYNGIMRRRKKRAELEASDKRVQKFRKPYMHLSRHLHAMRRPRGSGGRFLNAKDSDNSKKDNKTNSKNLLPLYNSTTGSSQISEVLHSDGEGNYNLTSNGGGGGGDERSYSPGSEVNSHHHHHHHMFSFDMNDHIHHHTGNCYLKAV